MTLVHDSWTTALEGWATLAPAATAFRYLRDGEEETARLSWADLEARIAGAAAALRRNGLAGERVLLLQPPGLEFVTVFLGCLRGGIVAVPLYPPNLTRPDAVLARLLTVAADCRPAAAIVPEAQRSRFEAAGAGHPALRGVRWLPSESLADGPADSTRPAASDADLAFVQYTSGSTGAPRGVRVTHRNIAANARRITDSYGMRPLQASVSWLPPYHDMGLVGQVLHPVFIGSETTLMSPVAFLQRPLRWLEAISRFRANISFAPNFAYELVLRRVRPEHLLQLDLSCWTIAGNGAEPIRLDTLNRFAATFEASGFRREAFCPSYGLAECTLLASSERGVRSLVVARAALETGVVATGGAASDARPLVSMGRPPAGLGVRIVDPEALTPADANRVGEVWISGDSVADGYFNRPEETAATFGARLTGDPARYLRTGDLGFLRDGALFVTGRLKDLIIVDGRNHYPQDIEDTVAGSIAGAGPSSAIAFSVDRNGGEELVVAAESPRGLDPSVLDNLILIARTAIADRHGLRLAAFVWVRPGGLPRTGSGKPRRRSCREAYLSGALGAAEAAP